MNSERLTRRWEKERFLLLERDPEAYQRLSKVIEGEPPSQAEIDRGLELLDHGLSRVPTPETRREAALAVWASLKNQAAETHRVQAEELIGRIPEDPWAIIYLKSLFKILAAQQKKRPLLESSYLHE